MMGQRRRLGVFGVIFFGALLTILATFGIDAASAAVPLAPTNLTVSSTVSGTQKYATANLSWTLGSDGGATITNHQWSVDGANWNNFSEGLVTGTSGSIPEAAQLNFGTSYTFRLRAVNSAGNGTAVTAGSSITFLPGECSPTLSADGKSYIFTTVGVCNWTLPSAAKSTLAFDIRGAQGGGSYELKGNSSGTSGGGLGARVRGSIDLSSFNSLYIFVGSKGMENTKAARPLGVNSGGFNGGGDGNGGTYSNSSYTTAGGGGGATDLRTTLSTPTSGSDSRILVAGGGGGSTRSGNGGNVGNGGAGGSNVTAFAAVGTKGQDGTYSGDWAGGTGGLIASCSPTLYAKGGTSSNLTAVEGFGGGGGGYCGGDTGTDNGQGWGAPGGGGSSFASNTYVTATPTHTGGVQCFNGALILSISGYNASQVPAVNQTDCGGQDPDAPTLSVTTRSGAAALVWTDSNNGVSDYVVEYSTTHSFTSSNIFPDGVSANKFATVTGLTNGTTYYFRVKTINPYGISTYSNIASIIPNTPSAPATPHLDPLSDLGTSSTDNQTSDNSPTTNIASGLTTGASVTITATPSIGTPITCTFVATGASGSCTFSTLPNGTYSFAATQTVGPDTSPSSTALSNVVINTVTIPTPATPTLAAASDSGLSNSDRITNVKTPTINVTGLTATGKVTASKSGSADVSCTVSSGSCTLGNLSDGTWNIVVSDSDLYGNSSTSSALSITVDTSLPIPTVANQESSDSATVTVQSSKVGIAYLVRLDLSPTTVAQVLAYSDNLWNQVTISSANTDTAISTVGLDYGVAGSGGGNYYKLYVSDIAGNLSSASTNSVHVRSTYAPTISGVPLDSSTGSAPKVGNFLVPFQSNYASNIVLNNGSRLDFGLPTATVSYIWYVCGTSDVVVTGQNGPTLTLQDSDVGKSFKVTVTLTNSIGSATLTSSCSVAIASTTAAAPSGLVATSGNASATIAFTPPSSTGGASITNYKYSLDGVNYTTLSPATTSSPITISGLTNGTAYSITLKAVNSSGDSVSSTSVSVTPAAAPSAPTSLSATAGNGQASIAFTTPSSTGGASIINYKYSIDGVTYTALSPATTSSPITISGLANGTAYTITLRAVNSAGESIASSGVTVTPATVPSAPTSLVATAGNGQGSIAFTAPLSNGGFAISNYKYSTDGTTYIALNPATTSSPITISGLTNGTSYTVRLKAVSAFGDSIASSPVSFTPATSPGAPTIGTATATGSNSASIAFIAPVLNGGSPITGYTVISSPGGASGSGSSSPISISGLAPNTSYTFTVVATNAAGSSLASSSSSPITTAKSAIASSLINGITPPVQGAIPVSGASGNTQFSASVTWDPATSPFPSGTVETATVTITPAINFTLDGIPANFFTVTGAASVTHSAINSDVTSMTVTVVFPATASLTLPDAPTNVLASNPTQSSLDISFTPPSNTGGTTITGYVVTASPGGLSVSGTSSPIRVIGLAPGRSYSFTVTALNSVGSSTASSASPAVATSSPPPPPDPVQLSSAPSTQIPITLNGSSNTLTVPGSYIEKVVNITLGGLSLPMGSWTQTGTTLSITLPSQAAGTYPLQILNGSFPLLPTQYVTFGVSTPTPNPTPSATPTPTVKPSATPTPTVKPSATPTPTPSATPTPTVKPSATPTPTPSATPTPTVKPSATPTPTVKPSATPTPTVKPSATPTPTVKPSATPTVKASSIPLRVTPNTTQRPNAPTIVKFAPIVPSKNSSSGKTTSKNQNGSIALDLTHLKPGQTIRVILKDATK